MRIENVTTRNYRSLEDFTINFSKGYTLIGGKNNSGKSSIFKAIRVVLGSYDDNIFTRLNRIDFEWATDITFWKKDKSEDIEINLHLTFNNNDDPALSQFISRMSKIDITSETKLCIKAKINSEGRSKRSLFLGEDAKELDEYAAQEIVRWIREKEFIVYHDSTRYASARYYYRQKSDFSPSGSDMDKIAELNAKYSSTMKKILKLKKESFEEILGRLGEKYTVELQYPKLNFESTPFEVTLSEQKGGSASLDDWGSGTRNRTLVLSSIWRARQSSRDPNPSSRFLPLVIIEEPESFLHPSAQSDFGRAIEDMSNEFNLQVIVSSHSPFMLSRQSPEANILLERVVRRNLPAQTRICDTSGENWMMPFANALGLAADDLSPWAGILQGGGSRILVVEGVLDQKYINAYCEKREALIDKSITIKPIGGKDKLNDLCLTKFISSFVDRVVFMLDLDATSVEEKFRGIGFVKGRDYIIVGKDNAGLRRMEGVLPEEVRKRAYDKNTEIVNQMQSDKSEEKKSGMSRMKEEIYKEFCIWLDAGNEAPEFRKLLLTINRCFLDPGKKSPS